MGLTDEPIRLRIGGTEYEIDLSKKRHRVGRKLALFIEHTRRAGQGQPRRPGRTAASRKRSGGIRAWAKDQGIAVSRGDPRPASSSSAVPPPQAMTKPDRQGPPTLDQPVEGPLNAFDIIFDGRLSAGRK
jgi:Lsr2